MYSKLTSAIVSKEGTSEFFRMLIGTRQGCLVSPLLFIIYVNTILDMSSETGPNGIFVDDKFDNVSALLYADDLILVSDTVGHLNKLVECLSEFCNNWGLTVNISKTKVMVFRNGGILRKYENWYLKNNQIENVTYYKYLGLTFSNRLIWSSAQQTLAAQANKVIALILKTTNSVKFCDINMLWTLFDKMVLPILMYGSEIWGVDTHECIERVQSKLCKYVLKVPINTANVAVRGECGRYCVKTITMLKVLKYWCKLLYMNDSRLPKSCYNMLYMLDNGGRVTWATKVKIMLYKLGFGYVGSHKMLGMLRYFK
jgi:hypothetical protein